jgi:hypothetical protein
MAMTPSPYHPVSPSKRPRCPVCHKDVYSRSGIHPQCAVQQQEMKSKATQKAALKSIGAALGEG